MVVWDGIRREGSGREGMRKMEMVGERKGDVRIKKRFGMEIVLVILKVGKEVGGLVYSEERLRN